MKKRFLFVTILTTSEHRFRCDWIVTVLAGKTKFLAAGLKKGILGGAGVWFFLFSGPYAAVFPVILRCGFPYGFAVGRTYFAGKDSGSGDGLLMQHKAQ